MTLQDSGYQGFLSDLILVNGVDILIASELRDLLYNTGKGKIGTS